MTIQSEFGFLHAVMAGLRPGHPHRSASWEGRGCPRRSRGMTTWKQC